MGTSIHKLIAAINPDIYCEKFRNEYDQNTPIRDEVKKYLKENKGKGSLAYLKAAEKAAPKESEYMDFEKKIPFINPFALPGLKNPIQKHILSYDAFSENLEPIYFWIVDTLAKEYKDFDKTDKLVDNFSSSPGSSHFSEMGQKATRMQDEAMKILGGINQVLKSILNILYDLKEFRMRLDHYDNLKKEEFKNSAILSLKQIWMDSVDVKRGNTSLKGLAQQFQYVTIIDAFMACDSVKRVKDIDLNERIKRILEQRVVEFFDWVDKSEKELRNRYEIEKNYLKSQYNTVQLYVRWAKPYLRSAQILEQKFDRYSPNLVSIFNTSVFELTLLAQGKYTPAKDVGAGILPDIFAKKKIRKYSTILVVELSFRSVPERAGQQGYGFRGKVDITFTSYALRDDEIKLLKELIEKDDMDDAMKLIEGATTDSIEKMREEIEFFIKDLDSKSKPKEEKKEDLNPFTALFKSDKKDTPESKKSDSPLGEPDNEMEKVARSQAIIQARAECQKFYGLYKRAHNMPTM